MKLTIPRADLSRALNIVKPATTSSATTPALANVALAGGVQAKLLRLRCTNGDVHIETTVEATVEESGDCTVNASLLAGLCGSFPGAHPVELTALTSDLKIVCGDAKYKLATLPKKEMPAVPKADDATEVFTLEQSVLKALLTSTAFCCGTDPSRAVFLGALVKLNGDLTVVACDGKRVAVDSAPLPAGENAKSQFILPSRTIKELLRLLSSEKPGEGEEPLTVKISIAKAFVQFEIGQTTVTSKVVDGEYPNYTKIVPAQTELGDGVPIGRADLLGVLRRVGLVAEYCELGTEEQMLTVRGKGKLVVPGEAMESLLIPPSKTINQSFAISMITEALASIESDEVLLHLISENRPAVLRVKDRNWTFVVTSIAKGKEKEKETKPAAK